MKINENSILAVMNPFALLTAGAVICIIGFICARKYRDTNDFFKSTKLFVPFILLVDAAIYSIVSIPVILLIGLDICGFITMAFASNYYFYH